MVEQVERSCLLELAVPHPGERILDVGCGTGISTRWLAGGGTEITGVDRDPGLLAAAREKLPTARFVESDARRLPFPDGSFDLVVAVTLLCFLDMAGRTEVVEELVRVTRPGGRVVVGELARYSAWALERRARGWLGSSTWRNTHFFTSREIAGLMVRAGAARPASRHALYLPPFDHPVVLERAGSFERLGRRLGPVGAAFVVVRGEKPSSAVDQLPVHEVGQGA